MSVMASLQLRQSREPCLPLKCMCCLKGRIIGRSCCVRAGTKSGGVVSPTAGDREYWVANHGTGPNRRQPTVNRPIAVCHPPQYFMACPVDSSTDTARLVCAL